jgi:hypothetical protein
MPQSEMEKIRSCQKPTPQREFISELAKIRPCRQYPDSAWDSMIESGVIGAVTEERFSDVIYKRILEQMEQYE